MNSRTFEQRRESESLLGTFLKARGLSAPDGRPLYGYRCTAIELDQIRRHLELVFPLESDSQERHEQTCALFCLYGAEWWRRNYSGGPWRWQEILEILGASNPSQQRRAAIVERGLAQWCRRVLCQSDYREFLGTLAIEGGLPLNVVRNDTGKLRSYFRAVLHDLKTYSQSYKAANEIASWHAEILPKTLRQGPVYELAGSLAQEVWKLQNQVPVGQDPVSYLNSNIPEWRQQLPLMLEDETAKAFLNGLVQDAARVASRGTNYIKAQHFIRVIGGRLRLMAAVRIPSRISAQQLCLLFNTYEFENEPRFELCVELSSDGETVLAWATAFRHEWDIYYSFDVRHSCEFQADWEQPIRLIARIGARHFKAIDLRGGDALTDLPWVFANDGAEEDDFTLRGQGSARIRGDVGVVAIPEGAECKLDDQSTLEFLGKLPETGREVFRFTGSFTLPDVDGALCRISTGSEGYDDNQYSLSGKQWPFTSGHRLEFLGPPTLRLCEAGTSVKHIPSHKVQWCRSGSRTWALLNDEALGDGTVRYIENDEVRFRRSLTILPPDLSVAFGRDATLKSGTIYMGGLGVAEVGLDSHVISSQQEEDAGERKIFLSTEGEPPLDVKMAIRWRTGDHAIITLPFPTKGAKFITKSGTVLPKGCRVLLDRLSAVRASGLMLGMADSYTLYGRLLPTRGEGCAIEEFSFPFPINNESEHQILDLSLVRERVKLLLSSSTRLDAFVELRIEAPGAKEYPKIRVSRYDLMLQRDEDKKHLTLKFEDSTAGLSSDLSAHLEVEMRPVWNPEIAPVNLALNNSSAWEIPQNLESGPWLVTGREGNLYRVRPFIIPIESEATSLIGPGDELEGILRIAALNERRRSLNAALKHFILEHRSPKYEAISKHIGAFKHLSPTVLDIMVGLSETPEAAILALCQQGKAMLECWELFEQLPFSWFLVPVKSWLSAFARERRFYEAVLAEVPKSDELISEIKRSALESIPANPSSWELRRVLAESGWEGDLLKNREFKLASMEGAWVYFEPSLKAAQQSLFHRQSGKLFPQSHMIEDFRCSIASNYPALGSWLKVLGNVRFRWAVLCAPVVAAAIAAYEIPNTEALVFDIRMLRAFDPEFFDETYRVILTWLIGDILRNEPHRLRV